METEMFIKILTPGARIPEYATIGSAAMDLYASEDIEIASGSTGLVPLGFATEMRPNVHGRIESRSGMAIKDMVVLTGVIDSDYRGEWKVILRNIGNDGKPYKIAKGDRVAQVVIREHVKAHLTVVSELSGSSRGTGGFGSTGTR